MLINLTIKNGDIFSTQVVDIIKYRAHRFEGEQLTILINLKKNEYLNCKESPDDIMRLMGATNGR